MRIGIDCYTFRRLQVRPVETDACTRIPDRGSSVIRKARHLGVDGVSLETCYLPPFGVCKLAVLRPDAASLELELASASQAPNGAKGA